MLKNSKEALCEGGCCGRLRRRVGDGSGSAPETRKSEAFIAKGQGRVSGNTGGKGTPWPN